MAGVALIMIVDQLPRLTGVRASGSGFFPQRLSAVRHVSEAHWPTVVLAAAVLVVLFAAPFLWRTHPGPLLVLVAATAAVAVFGLDDRYGITVIGSVPVGLPAPNCPALPICPTCCCPPSGSCSSATRT